MAELTQTHYALLHKLNGEMWAVISKQNAKVQEMLADLEGAGYLERASRQFIHTPHDAVCVTERGAKALVRELGYC